MGCASQKLFVRVGLNTRHALILKVAVKAAALDRDKSDDETTLVLGEHKVKEPEEVPGFADAAQDAWDNPPEAVPPPAPKS